MAKFLEDIYGKYFWTETPEDWDAVFLAAKDAGEPMEGEVAKWREYRELVPHKMAEQASQGKKVDCSMSVKGEEKAKIDTDGHSSFLAGYLYSIQRIKANPENQVQISLSNSLALQVMATMQQALMEERDYLLEKLKYVS